MSLFGIGGSSSSSRSKSRQESFGLDITQQALDPGQAAMQQALMGQFFPALGYAAGNLYPGQQAGSMYGRNQQQLARAQNFGNASLNRGQIGFRGVGDAAGMAAQQANQLQQGANLGMFQTAGFAQQNNPYLQQQISGLAQDFGQLYQEQLLPGIRGQFTGGGQRGSSRQGIAEALGMQRIGQEFGQAATNLRAGAYGQQQQAAQALASMGLQGSLQARGLAGDLRSQQMGAGYQYGLAGLGLAQSGAGQGMDFALQSPLVQQQLALNPFQIGAGIVGQPSVLTQGLGMDYSLGTSESKGSSASANIGFG